MSDEDRRYEAALYRKQLADRLPNEEDFLPEDLIRYRFRGMDHWTYVRMSSLGIWYPVGFDRGVRWGWLTDRWLQSRDVRVEFLGLIAGEGPYAQQDSTTKHHLMWTDALKPEKKEEKIDTKMRRFQMWRDKKQIAEGVQFTDGTVTVRWLTEVASTVVWSGMGDLINVANSMATTAIQWIDEEQN